MTEEQADKNGQGIVPRCHLAGVSMLRHAEERRRHVVADPPRSGWH
ncbi:hypothetical protein JQX13_34350 [Archangium violaceum]|nr:hypothetical protein [Archangium violaceum]QRK05250.1 hypothetical protein JQX13_34350 [Archangium violaceum]